MTTRDLLQKHLPELRAYAAAMTASTAAGDELVELCMLMALERPNLFKASHCRLVLFRALHQLIITPRKRLEADDDGSGKLMSMDERALVLLIDEQAFELDEAAFVVGLDLPMAQRIHRRAAGLASRSVSARVLILEDDALMVRRLTALCRKEGLDVVAQTGDPDEAVRLARDLNLDLMLVDFSLGDSQRSGLWAVREARGHSDFAVVYVTGSPEAVSNEMLRRDRLVSKPFLPSAISFALQSALDVNGRNRPHDS